MKWISTTTLLVVLGLGLPASRTMAQQGSDQQSFEDIRARLAQQDKQIEQLQAQLSAQQTGPTATPAAYAPAGDAKAVPANPAAPAKPPEPYVIGSDLSLKGSLKDGLFPWFETPNKDFSLHISFWFQWDNVWWDQSPGLMAARGANAGPAQGVASGATLGGIGNLQDGMYFRRIRPNFEGVFFENGEYRFIPAFENNQFNAAGIDEVWVGAKNVPFVGTIRVGHVKNALGLEADMNGSSRCMTFMERSSYSEAIELNQNFASGILFTNTMFDQRATWTMAWFRPDVNSSTDSFFGDGQAGFQARLTGLPFYEDEGRHLLHLGVSGGWRNGTVNLANSPVHTVQLRARPELRDDAPGGGLPNSDSNRMIDTGLIVSDVEYLMGLEALYIRGPLSLQAEYGWNWVDNAAGILKGTAVTPFASAQNYMFNGGYVQLAYTLTGENRGYDKRGGAMSRSYFGSRGPYADAFIVRDENGNIISSWGAWEVASRYSYVNLNDGLGPTRIEGGIMDGVSVGLNWYLNNNLSCNFEWSYNNRYDLPDGSVPGHTSGFGSRVQFQF